jgi:hypothetical protein
VAIVNEPSESRPLNTKEGTRLEPAYEQNLAAEAEAGFDPSSLIPRRAGRPSLSGRSGHSNRLDLRVDDDTYNAIQRIAERNQRTVSDVVRDAIREYLHAS